MKTHVERHQEVVLKLWLAFDSWGVVMVEVMHTYMYGKRNTNTHSYLGGWSKCLFD